MNHDPTPVSRTGINAASAPTTNPFAVHGDPSQRQHSPGQDDGKRRVRWTRLSELHHDPRVTDRTLRGVDLYGRLMRAGRRAPVRAVKASARATAMAAARGLAYTAPAFRSAAARGLERS